ncbi:MAG: hypothetical protein HOB20_10850 [Planctomycetaceae bacterium]|jgi:hypothetical protein|nr:hypothetical protein [Planctomycetaceae bacterium]
MLSIKVTTVTSFIFIIGCNVAPQHVSKKVISLSNYIDKGQAIGKIEEESPIACAIYEPEAVYPSALEQTRRIDSVTGMPMLADLKFSDFEYPLWKGHDWIESQLLLLGSLKPKNPSRNEPVYAQSNFKASHRIRLDKSN